MTDQEFKDSCSEPLMESQRPLCKFHFLTSHLGTVEDEILISQSLLKALFTSGMVVHKPPVFLQGQQVSGPFK